MSQPHFKQIRGKVTPGMLDISTASAPGDPASRSFVQTTIDNSLYGLDFKPSVRVATTGNLAALSGLIVVDGITLLAGDRVLVKDQTTQTANGIWVAAAGAWARSPDADNNGEVTAGMAVSVEEGTTNARTTWRISNTGNIVLGTTNITFQLFSSTYYATPTAQNKNMAALLTTNDFDLACNTGIAATPAQGSFVEVKVNGLTVNVGNGVKTGEAYFSGDSGTTARALNAILAGDKLYWVGSAAGYQLDTNDRVDFVYVV
ncbi:hypothetical protein DYU11_22615 [Fibrisoma montanum]|uniref:Uncharacterized protein n=1 Tax=Fibrisoma montanum TaxID=2305895 RepID=A0A418M247_9BACT|nr:hypothetical protein [Fibrisoma montanum]RIV19725.1 hypothetical protein DYU11_22615 [Fibrisoma montanum]